MKSTIIIQTQVRGYLARIRYKRDLEINKINEKKRIFEKLHQSVKTIQSCWRGYAIRKLYNQIKLENALKKMQVNYFHQQVI